VSSADADADDVMVWCATFSERVRHAHEPPSAVRLRGEAMTSTTMFKYELPKTLSDAAVVLLSGGMDSAACLALAHRCYPAGRVRALVVDYGQPHRDRETTAAGLIAGHVGVPSERICVADAMAAMRPRRMARAVHEPAAGGAQRPHPAEVPQRNTVLLSLAAGHGMAWWPDASLDLWIGATSDDAAGFADCRPEFMAAASHCFSTASPRTVRVVAPLVSTSKRELVASASRDVLWLLRRSWSCYRGGERPCGECTPCVLRADAFEAAGILACVDPDPSPSQGDRT